MASQNIIILLGAPASGKGTQAKRLAAALEIPHISTGDIFRAHIAKNSELGKEAKLYIDRGELVPSTLVISLFFDTLDHLNSSRGYLLDGFPRTLDQAEALSASLPPTSNVIAINLNVPENVLLERILKRSQIEGRSDDNETIAKERLAVYFKETFPLIDYYQKKGLYHEIDGNRSIDEVFQALFQLVR